MQEPQPGTTANAELTVTTADLASALPLAVGDAFPAVFATARMVALMEIACARLMLPWLKEGQLSVGVSVEATHTAPTPPGVVVRAEAVYLGLEGKLHAFEVVASDAGGEIGRARHQRAIVDAARLQAKAAQRVQASSV